MLCFFTFLLLNISITLCQSDHPGKSSGDSIVTVDVSSQSESPGEGSGTYEGVKGLDLLAGAEEESFPFFA